MAGQQASLPHMWLERIEAMLASGKRCILGLAGTPGAGKSTLAERIGAHFGARAAVVPMDGFHLANAELARLGRADRKGAPDTFDSAGYVALLARLRAAAPDETVYAPAFRREIEEPVAGAIPVPPAVRLVITEGNYLLLQEGFWRSVRPLLDAVWFVDIDADQRRERLVARHRQFGRDEAAARDWVRVTDEPNARVIEVSRSRADLVVQWPPKGAI